MLQKIHDSIGRWIAGVILGLLAIAFVFWGVDFTLTGSGFAAKVNGEEISLTEFERELQAEQNNYAELYRSELTEDMRRVLRRNVIERMVANEALEQRVQEAGYRISDERLTDFIRGMPVFQIDGNFSLPLYNTRLSNEGLSPPAFEELQRRQMELLDLQRGVAESTFLTPAEFRRYIELYNQRREVAYALFEAESFLEGVEVTDEDIAAYYEANRDRYLTEESVDIEYIELSQADVADEVEVTEEDLRAYYEEQRDRFVTEEERHARHILLTGDTEQARAAAASIVERLEAGEDFATLAAELSQDAVTRAEGGDLGWIGRGMLGGPFEEALYEMQVGEVRGPVETEFGVHVIKLEDVRAGEARSFEAVADELRQEYRSLEAEEIFYNRANELADKAFDAIDMLAGAAEEMGLPLKRRDGFPRSGDPELFGINSAPVVQAAFDQDAIERMENSDLIELADDHVLVLRVVAHHPSELQPLEAVRAQVEEELRRTLAEDRAAEAAAAFLATVETPNEGTAGAQGDESVGAQGDESVGAQGDESVGAQGDESVGAQGDESVGAASAPRPPETSDAAPGAEAAANVERETDQTASEPPEGAEPDATASSLAPLAATHNGTWHERTWVERTSGEMPSEVLATVFAMPAPSGDQPRTDSVPLASGDHAVVLLYAVQPGTPDQIPREERDQRQRQLADQAALGELNAYVGNVRNDATVRIPDEVLEPTF